MSYLRRFLLIIPLTSKRIGKSPGLKPLGSLSSNVGPKAPLFHRRPALAGQKMPHFIQSCWAGYAVARTPRLQLPNSGLGQFLLFVLNKVLGGHQNAIAGIGGIMPSADLHS